MSSRLTAGHSDPPTDVDSGVSPFKGLEYFDHNSDDERRFGGRETDITAVRRGILRSRNFVVYGRSGLGKTSLLLAGVFPGLEAQGCLPVHVRTLEDPLQDLYSALTSLVPDSDTHDLRTLISEICLANDNRTVVIVFDQFEEFFIRFSEDSSSTASDATDEKVSRARRRALKQTRAGFIEEMGALTADPDLNLRLVWCLREDWIAEMSDFASAIPTIAENMYRLLPLTAFGVRQSILRALEVSGVRFDAPLLSALVDTLADYDFDPSVLQVVCSQIWQQAQEKDHSTTLTVDDLEAIGGVAGVFEHYLDVVKQEIPEDDRRLRVQVRAVLDSLITEKRTKRALKHSQLLDSGFMITDEELDSVLTLLTRNRLVRADDRGGDKWYELIHERLVENIIGWLGADEDFFQFRAARKLVQNLSRNEGWEDNPRLLLSDAQLDETIGPFRELLKFNATEFRFLISSAVAYNANDLEYWSHVVGGEKTCATLNKYLSAKGEHNAPIRANAITAAGRLPEYREKFAPLALRLAIDDDNQQVLSAAAQAFVEIAGEHDYQQLQEQLLHKTKRRNGMEILAKAVAAEAVPKGVRFGRLQLWRARRLLYRERASDSAKLRVHRSKTGAVTGLLAAITWVATAGVLGTRIGFRELEPNSIINKSGELWMVMTALMVSFGLPLGVLFGWLVARRAAREALLTGREGASYRAVLGRPLRRLLVFLLVVSAAFSFLYLDSSELNREILVFSGLVPAIVLLLTLPWVGLIVWLAHPSFQAAGARSVWLRAWVWAFGGSMILPMLCWLAFPYAIDNIGSVWDVSENYLRSIHTYLDNLLEITLVGLVFSIGAASGLLIFTSILSLARTSPAWNSDLPASQAIGAVPNISMSPIRRWFGAGLCLVVVGILWFTNRLDGIVALPDALKGSEPLELSTNYGSGIADTENFTILVAGNENRDAQPRIARVFYNRSIRKAVVRGRSRFNSGETVVFERGLNPLAFQETGLDDREVIELAPTVTILPDSLEQKLTIAPGSPVQVVVPMAFEPNSGGTNFRLSRTLDVVSGAKGDIDVRVGNLARCEEDGVVAELDLGGAATDTISVFCERHPGTIEFPTIAKTLQAPKQLQLALDLSSYLPRLQRPEWIANAGSRINSTAFLMNDPDITFPYGYMIATAQHQSVVVWQGFERLWSFQHYSDVVAVSAHQPSNRLASASEDGLVRIFDTSSFSQDPIEVFLHTGASAKEALPLSGVDFDASGTRIVTASGSRATIWKLNAAANNSGPLVLRHDAVVNKASFNGDGSIVATAADDGVYLWDSVNGDRIDRMGIEDGVWDVKFSPDDKYLLALGQNRLARVWRLDADSDPQILSHNGSVWSGDFSPVDMRLVTGSEDGTATSWVLNTQSGLFEKELVLVHGSSIWSVAFDSSGRSVVTGATDAQAKVWNVKNAPKARGGEVYVFLQFESAATSR